jgi:cytidylate kinase
VVGRKVSTIAIDGPAASGKTTLARELAARLGYFYFDTGVMYRAVTLFSLRDGVSVEDEPAVTAVAEELVIDVCPPSVDDGRLYDVIVDSEDVTWEIRSHQVDQNVSLVSSYAGVRQALSHRQREIGSRGNVVMVGRDIGTVVMPEADLKIYLEASEEERARRRYHEAVDRGEKPGYEDILGSMKKRDHFDSTRSLAPLKPAEDAIRIETTGIAPEEVLERVLSLTLDKGP